jgi:hypothetical protein
MASNTGMLYSKPTSQENTYYPLLINGLEGMNLCGIDEDFEYTNKSLSVKKLITQTINGVDSRLFNDTIVNNLFQKIQLSPTWVAYGDRTNPTGEPIWSDYLATLTGTSYINRLVDKTHDITCIKDNSNPVVIDTTYANYSSIVMTGFNEVRSTGTLYSDTNQSFYMKSLLSTALTLSIPQNKIQNIRDISWIAQGTWRAHSSILNIGVKTNGINDFQYKNVGTTRYIVVRITTDEQILGYNWEIYVNDNLVGTLQGTTPTGEGTTFLNNTTYNSIATIIDLGKNVDDCLVKIVNKSQLNGVDIDDYNYLDFIACYTDADLVNAKPVLLLSTPRFNYQLDTNATNNKRIAINDAKKSVARLCRLMGLPVSYYDLSEASMLMYDDINPTTPQHEFWAKDILSGAISQ